ncbi:hypothetical protein T12_9681 [Trichinella patagoniensis]|uniref:Uncharacterized protein n=1 Tax=Trichinella patagoniensis TaxID=990121 RepID=A0A0V0YQS0_9BILA|nr:hypothetical protein T12_9681 [Trichinella patagoniensis]
MPQGIKKFAYSLRLCPRRFIAQYLPSGKIYANFQSPGGYASGYASGNFSKIFDFSEI